MKDFPDKDMTPAAPEPRPQQVPALEEAPQLCNETSAQGKAKLPELVTIVILIVGCGAGVFWINHQADSARKDLQARLEGVISQQVERISKLETEMAEVHKGLKSAFGDTLPAAFKALSDKIDDNHRPTPDTLSSSRSPPQAPPAEPRPTESKPEAKRGTGADLLRDARLRAANLPFTTEELPDALRPEEIKTPALRKAAEQFRPGERELQKELLDDFTNKILPDGSEPGLTGK